MSKTIDKQVEHKSGEKIKVYATIDPEQTKELGEGVLEAVVTTNTVDRQNEVIETTGIDTSNFIATGGPVLYGHDYESLPIGKTIKLTEMKNKIKARFQLAIQEYDFAQTVYNLIKGGYLNAVSIGGIVREWSEDYKTILKMEMVEFSVVPIPANAQAIITQRSLEQASGKTAETIKNEYEDFSRKILLDKLSGMPQDEIKDAVSVLENLTARLKETATAPSSPDAKKIKVVRHLMLKDAKAVATQSQRVVKTIKLSIREESND